MKYKTRIRRLQQRFAGISDADLARAFYLAQADLFSAYYAKDRRKAGKRRTAIGDEQMRRRSEAIFAAGAAAHSADPAAFDGRTLGAMESETFYAGYRSTHPDIAKLPERKIP